MGNVSPGIRTMPAHNKLYQLDCPDEHGMETDKYQFDVIMLEQKPGPEVTYTLCLM